MTQVIVGTGLTSMVSSRFIELYEKELDFVNLDLATGVDITNEQLVKTKIGESRGGERDSLCRLYRRRCRQRTKRQ